MEDERLCFLCILCAAFYSARQKEYDDLSVQVQVYFGYSSLRDTRLAILFTPYSLLTVVCDNNYVVGRFLNLIKYMAFY